MKRSKSSKRWLREHFNDQFVKQAHAHGYRGRAAYKLLEIQRRDHILDTGMTIVDLGAAPGGWSQVAARILRGRGHIYALDILPMEPIENVTFMRADFRDENVVTSFQRQLSDVDVVLSDMAPNLSGIRAVDQAKIMYLAETALAFALQVLKPNGTFLVKVFQGEGFEPFLRLLRKHFARVASRKPQASRDRSRELYLLARGYKPVIP